MSEKLIMLARSIALGAPGVGGRNGHGYRIGAIIHDGPRVLAVGVNSYKTHTRLTEYTKFPYLHAEAAAMLKLGMDNCVGLDMIVVRVRRDGAFAMARPCERLCMPMLFDFGIRSVAYSTDTEVERLVLC